MIYGDVTREHIEKAIEQHKLKPSDKHTRHLVHAVLVQLNLVLQCYEMRLNELEEELRKYRQKERAVGD